MISRMIELDSEQAEDLFAYRRDYLRPLWESYAAGFGTKGSNDAGQDADGRKGNSARQDADGKKGNRAQDRRLRDLMAMLQVPSLFRMIVARRFTDFGEARNVAELYSRLFHSLLNYRDILNEVKEKALVEKYEDFAIRIFNYDNDTCPFSGKEAEDKELLYLFYTKRGKDEGGSGRLGFLHRLFYQYFLARYIVAAVRKGDSEELFLNFRIAKNADPDLWNLIVQLAELEQDKHNYPEEYPEHRDSEGHNLLYHSYAGRIQAKHIKSVLDFLSDDDAVRKAAKVEEKDLLTRSDTRLGIGGQADDDAGDWAQVGRDENADERGGAIREAWETENAILNLVSICAAMEKGCRIVWNAHGAGEDGKPSATGVGQDSKTSVTGAGKKSRSQADPIAYADYSYLCERLHRGDYSGIYLEEANLDGCLLENARFRRAHMAGIHLVGAKLDGADLAGADMKKAFLQGASLKRANLSRAILEEAHMEKAVFHKMLPDAAYNAIRMDGLVPDASAVRMDGARLEEADLSKVRLEWANLTGANLDRADLREAHLDAAILIGASLAGADLRKARFNDEDSVRKAGGERLEKARLEKACMEKTQVQGEAQKTDDVSENSGIYDSE